MARADDLYKISACMLLKIIFRPVKASEVKHHFQLTKYAAGNEASSHETACARLMRENTEMKLIPVCISSREAARRRQGSKTEKAGDIAVKYNGLW